VSIVIVVVVAAATAIVIFFFSFVDQNKKRSYLRQSVVLDRVSTCRDWNSLWVADSVYSAGDNVTNVLLLWNAKVAFFLKGCHHFEYVRIFFFSSDPLHN